MTPKQFIKYTQKLDKKGYAVCDGMTEDFSIFNVLYPLFVITGAVIFIHILLYWKEIKNKIFGNKEGYK